MNKANLKPLSEKEMSQLVGGKWLKIEGKWIWVSEQKVESQEDVEPEKLLNIYS